MLNDQVLSKLGALFKWDQQKAKAKFSEVVRKARDEGPQLVTTRGAKPVVVVSAEQYLALTEGRPRRFSDLLLPGGDFEPVREIIPLEYEPFRF